MYFFFILFFVSLAIIMLMIVRKLLLINNIEEHHTHHVDEMFLHKILDFKKIKYLTVENLKKIEHALIWIIVRTYLVSLNFINKKRKGIAIKIKSKLNRNYNDNILEEKKEVSKYIKIISEYRQKIRKIKHKIKEEEGLEYKK
jgi:hypothetical protein